MIEVILNDRLGRKIRVKCNPDDTVGDLKKLVAAQCVYLLSWKAEPYGVSDTRGQKKDPGTRPDKIRIQKWYTVYKDHITLEDYEIHDGMGLELYYN